MPRELAARVVTFDTLYATLDIAEVAASAKRPVELVAAIYFDLANRLGLPWLREKIAALPGDQHWQMLRQGGDAGRPVGTAARDHRRGAGRAATAQSPATLLGAWQDANRRALERAAQLLAELRATPAPDAAMLSVALRELRNLG